MFLIANKVLIEIGYEVALKAFQEKYLNRKDLCSKKLFLILFFDNFIQWTISTPHE